MVAQNKFFKWLMETRATLGFIKLAGRAKLMEKNDWYLNKNKKSDK